MQDFLHTPAGLAPVEIVEDGGGLVTSYQRKAYQYTLEGRRVEIKGSCRSACLLALSVPDVCVAPGAVVKAHHAYEQFTKVVRTDITREMLQSLPENIKNQLAPRMQTHYTSSTTLTYDELRNLGIADCNQPKAKTAKIKKPKETALSQILKFFGR